MLQRATLLATEQLNYRSSGFLPLSAGQKNLVLLALCRYAALALTPLPIHSLHRPRQLSLLN